MVSRAQYTIGELVERTGVPATTIHHYRHLGLLPAPEPGVAKRFVYDERHVQALRLVRLLRERRHLSLDTIREVLPELLAVDEEAFRPAMWDQVVASHEGGRARAAILDAARHAFVAHGYADVNVADVADAVGVGKGTVYRHFASKEDLFAAAAASAVGAVIAAFTAGIAGGGGTRRRPHGRGRRPARPSTRPRPSGCWRRRSSPSCRCSSSSSTAPCTGSRDGPRRPAPSSGASPPSCARPSAGPVGGCRRRGGRGHRCRWRRVRPGGGRGPAGPGPGPAVRPRGPGAGLIPADPARIPVRS